MANYVQPPKIWRQVVQTKSHCNPGYWKHWAVGGSYVLMLECGHTGVKKFSQGVPKRMACRSCYSLKHYGGETKRFNLHARTVDVETWDPSTELPRRITRPMTQEEITEWVRKET